MTYLDEAGACVVEAMYSLSGGKAGVQIPAVSIAAKSELSEETVQEAAEEMKQKAVGRLGDAGPASVTVRAVNGFVVKELVDASQDADLVVVGARAHSGFTRLLMGSVSSQVVHHASCPVVVIPEARQAS